MPQTKIWTGDPVWIADVLRAEGVKLVEYPGWQNRGHGDFKDIRGVMVHHTGSDNTSAASIAEGRPDLRGPLSQLHIARDGTVTIVAVGVAWHAGVGMYPWLPTNMGNWHLVAVSNAPTAEPVRRRRTAGTGPTHSISRWYVAVRPSIVGWPRPPREPSGTRSTRAARKASGIRAPSTWTSCAVTSRL